MTAATRPVQTPADPKVLAAPVNGVTVGGEEGTVPLVPFVGVDETSAKFAHVKRVALLLWITMDLSPKK